ncbi:hypothetical protein [Verrucomicrobium spinosum]|uniref:hypothetical protein n=1 Tax=Verrucomicrobium spinosum TaxID=2736 RepID=UPI0018DE0C82|nr:hypothetical protein [Verrucomicrobium spinosum]
MKSPANKGPRVSWHRSLLPRVAWQLLLLGTMPMLAQAQKGGEKSLTGAPEGASGVAAVTNSQGLGPFGRMLPVGQRNLDVKIPSFRDGRPNSLMRAGSMTRLDEDNMAIEKMDIRMFGPTKDRDVRVQLKTATYHMPSATLSSEQRSRISREDFQMEGDSMVFDTKTQQGKMTGNVRMVIFDTEAFTNGDAMSNAAPAPNGQPLEMSLDEESAEGGGSEPAPKVSTMDINAKAVERPSASASAGGLPVPTPAPREPAAVVPVPKAEAVPAAPPGVRAK